MKQLRLAFLIICNWLAGGSFHAHGALEWKEDELALNAKITDASVSCAYEFENKGDLPVTIRAVHTSCPCVSGTALTERHGLVNLLALGLPPFEIVVGCAIITGFQRRAALLSTNMLLVLFIAALGYAIIRGIPIDCGCFGHGNPTLFSAWLALGRDLILLASGAGLYMLDLGQAKPHEAEPKMTTRVQF